MFPWGSVCWFSAGRRFFLYRLRYRLTQGTVPCRVININTGLNVVSEHAKTHTITLVLDRVALHQNAVCQQVISFKNGGDMVFHMIACFR